MALGCDEIRVRKFEAYIDLFGVGLVPFHKRYVYRQEFTLVTYEKLKVKC